jgi:hypothetical protein
VWLAHVFVDGKQMAKTFRGTQKAVRAEVAAWEVEVLGRSASHLGATVADLRPQIARRWGCGSGVPLRRSCLQMVPGPLAGRTG